MVHGRIVDPLESPNRAATLIASLERAGLQRTEPSDYGREPILMVHPTTTWPSSRKPPRFMDARLRGDGLAIAQGAREDLVDQHVGRLDANADGPRCRSRSARRRSTS